MSEGLEFVEGWSQEGQLAAAEAIEAIRNGERRAWYCNVGRRCNGKPHKGYWYPHARGDQWPPPGQDWFAWFLSGGRGSGKTRTGAEYTRKMSERVGRMALIAPTGADVRDTMVEGESGLMFVAAMAGMKLKYEPSKRRITFPNGCIATTFSAEEPARLRGPQHGFAWMDEPAHYPLVEDVWDNLMFGLRLGDRPHVVLTSTPLPTKWVKAIQKDKTTKTVRVSTAANADNLAKTFVDKVMGAYAGTRIGLQELEGRLLEDVAGAMWSAELLKGIREPVKWQDLDRIVVAVDPAGTANRRSDETGIIVAGIKGDFVWVLEDASGKYSPIGWADKIHSLMTKYEADAIVAEKNYGGDMVKEVITSATPKGKTTPRILVKTAVRSKKTRAEPVVALYEQRRVYHYGNLAELEDEMLTWVPGQGDSPNRIDALVWAVQELKGDGGEATIFSIRGRGPQPKGNPDMRRGIIPDLSRLRRSS